MKKNILLAFATILICSTAMMSQDLVEVFPGFEGKGFAMLAWGDFDGDGDLDLITGGDTDLSGTKTDLYRNDGGGKFTLVENTGIPDLSNGDFDFADYDNDGDDDLLAMGAGINVNITAVFISNGDGTFTNANANIIDKVDLGTCNWTDYDGDGDLDIFITGFLDDGDNSTYVSRLFQNDGSGNFTNVENTGIQGVSYSSAAWADIDHDNDLDLYLQGLAWTGETDISIIYINNGDNTFTPSFEFLPLWLGDATWVDYDNDDDYDLMISGFNTNAGTRVTFLYKNTGSDFIRVADNIVGVSQSAFSWADYDLDGDLDFFIVGVEVIGNPMPAYIYENLGNDVFEQSSYEFTGNWFGDAAWADYDNDGDPDLVYTGQEFSGNNAIHTYRNDIITSTGEISGHSLLIYPKPASETITLKGMNGTTGRIEIIDVLGNIVWSQDNLEQNKINIQRLKSGVYFLRLENEQKITITKFVRQ